MQKSSGTCLFLSFAFIVLTASQAGAQAYVQTYPTTQPPAPQQQVSDNYNARIPAYNQPQYIPAPVQPNVVQSPLPGQAVDPGQSVMTDIRQMNF